VSPQIMQVHWSAPSCDGAGQERLPSPSQMFEAACFTNEPDSRSKHERKLGIPKNSNINPDKATFKGTRRAWGGH
jgi:hypothetical protein